MRIWKIVIRPDTDEADLAQGYARADTCEDALALADHPHALAFPMHPDKAWPGKADTCIAWVNAPAS